MIDDLAFLDERDRLFKLHGLRDGPFRREMMAVARSAVYYPPGAVNIPTGHSLKFRSSVLKRSITPPLAGGVNMEDTAKMLEATNRELEAAKETMQSLINELKAAADVIGPSLMEHIKQLRSARMTAVSEVRESITALRDVRAFFLEKDYAVEMERLERFVRVCRDFQALKADGTIDAVADLALRLAASQ